MAIISRLTGENVTTRYEAVGAGDPGPIFTEYNGNDRVLNRVVRVRILQRELADPATIDALSAEMERVSRLSHPAIERILDVLSIKDNLGIVLEARRGATLQSRIDKVGSFPVPYALDVLVAVAEALQIAHQGGVLHGALSASYIMLSPEGIIKLTGLGIAHAFASLPEGERPGGIPKPDDVSVRSDLMAFSMIFFAILSGKSAPTEAEIAQGPAAFNSSVPTALSNLTRCMTRALPPYRTMDEVLLDLRAIRDAVRLGKPMPAIVLPIDAPPPVHKRSPVKPARRPIRKVAVSKIMPTDNGVAPRSHFPADLPNPIRSIPRSRPAPVPAIRQSRSTDSSAAFPVPKETVSRRPAPIYETPEISRGPRESLGVRFFRAILQALALIVLAFVLLLGSFFYYTSTSPQEVTVPALRGRAVEQAQQDLNRIGLKLDVDSSGTYDSDIPLGHILSQVPDPGVHVKSPRTIHVVVSSGSRMVHVPSIVGKRLNDGMRILLEAGLPPKNNGEINSASVPNGGIALQWPPADRVVPRGTPGFLRVSAGPSAADLEAMAPTVPTHRIVSMDIPPDKSSNGIHWLPQSSTSRAAHTFEIREVSGSGEEKKLWQGSVAAGEKFQQDVVLDAYCRLKVYLDGKEVPTRFDIPEQDDTDGRMASAVD